MFAATMLAALAAVQPAASAGTFLVTQGVTTAAAACPSATLCDAGSLPVIAAKLRSAGRGERQVHILQIGDSHTAGDTITHGLRRRLQERYGNGGRGMLAAGTPYRGYLTFGVTASETPGWRSNVIFGSRWQPEGPALGLSGFTRTARTSGEWMALNTDSPDYNFDRAIICALTGPGQGTVTIRMGDREQSWSLDAPAAGAECKTLSSPAPVSRASVTTSSDAPVSITSFGTFKSVGGVVVSNVGVVGASLNHFARTDDRVLARELAAYRPDLVVLAYGTNEGFGTRLGAEAYADTLRAQVARLRRHLGRNVPIMLLGAPDAASRNAGIGASCGAGSFTPGALGEVRAVQRRVARELGLGFWDWEQAMGGRCATQAWVSSGLMRNDLVHFTREGGDRIGAMIFEDLERGRPATSLAAPVPIGGTPFERPAERAVGGPAPLPVAPARSNLPAMPPRLTHPGQGLDEPARRRPD